MAANRFDRLVARMDTVTQQRLGREVLINGQPFIAVESHFLAEMGAMAGDGLMLVIFSSGYHPRRNDVVEYSGETRMVTRFDMLNGKPRITVE